MSVVDVDPEDPDPSVTELRPDPQPRGGGDAQHELEGEPNIHSMRVAAMVGRRRLLLVRRRTHG